MKKNRLRVVMAAVIVQTTILFAPAQGQDSIENWSTDLLGAIAKSSESFQQDKAIQRSFKTELDREPSGPELQRFRRQMEDYRWTENDIRDDPRNRSDYRRDSWEANRDLDRTIRQAYDDILRREPDEEDLRYYRSRIIDNGWTERDVREDLQRSHAYGQHGTRISRQQAEQIVRRAYREVLGREPDSGAQGWVDKVLRDRWTEQDVVRALRDSDEFRSKHR